MKKRDFLMGLNEQQKEACICEDNLLLIACPGSGKTHVLTHRLAYLSEKYSDSRKLNIALTYTHIAADEMKERLREMNVSTESIWVGTIHQFCMQYIIRPYSMYSEWLKFGYRLIDEYESNKYQQEISQLLNQDKKEEKVQRCYKKKLRDEKLIDFDDILIFSQELLERKRFIAENLAGIIRSIQVDEYQDTNDRQYDILASIFSVNKKIRLAFVGDPNQAIYITLGGVAKRQKDLSAKFDVDFQQLKLSGCYRSSQKIIDYYSNFAVHPLNIESLCWSENTKSKIVYNKQIEKDELSQYIMEIIKKERDNGVLEKEICVVAPQWYLLFPVIEKIKSFLPNLNFDCPQITPFKYDPLNPFYLLAWLTFTETGERVWLRKENAQMCLDILKQDYGIRVPEDYSVLDLLRKINHINCYFDTNKDVSKILNTVFKEVLESVDASFRENEKLCSCCNNFIEQTRIRIRKNNLSSKIKDVRKSFKLKKGIIVSTIHALKGEEYTTVIAFGLLKGCLPHWNDVYDKNRQDGIIAKQLLYVLCSRAKRNLFLISESDRKTKNGFLYKPTEQLAEVDYLYDNL